MKNNTNLKTLDAVKRERERAVFREIGFLYGGKIALTIMFKNKEKNNRKRRMGYIAEVRKSKKRQKLLPKSLSFL